MQDIDCKLDADVGRTVILQLMAAEAGAAAHAQTGGKYRLSENILALTPIFEGAFVIAGNMIYGFGL